MGARVLPLRARTRPIATPRRDPRAIVGRALSRCAAGDRVLLALLLFERLTPAEAASVLGVPPARVERAYAGLLADLRVRLRRARPRAPLALPAAAPRFATPAARLPRAS